MLSRLISRVFAVNSPGDGQLVTEEEIMSLGSCKPSGGVIEEDEKDNDASVLN